MTSQSDREKYADQYVADRNVDPRTRSRVKPMRILALSMPRTGTMSMQAALEILGYGPTLHGFNLWMHTREVKMWHEGLQVKYPSSSSISAAKPKQFQRKEFDNLLSEYEVVSDFPSLAFSEELIKLYPEAKVIIVERDVDDWYKSFHDTIGARMFDPILYAIVALDPTMLEFVQMSRCWVRGYFQSNSAKELETNAKRIYKEHYEMIRRVTPKERLLDFKLGMGWEPLCAFLGEKEPSVEFPRINDTEDFKKRSNIHAKIASTRVLKKGLWWLASLGAIGVGLWWYCT